LTCGRSWHRYHLYCVPYQSSKISFVRSTRMSTASGYSFCKEPMPSSKKTAAYRKRAVVSSAAAGARNASDPRPVDAAEIPGTAPSSTAKVVRRSTVTAAHTGSEPRTPFPACPFASTDDRHPSASRTSTTSITCQTPTISSTVTIVNCWR